MKTNSIRQGCEQLYPGSHELRPLALFQVASPLSPTGTVAIASFGKIEELQGQPVALCPLQTVEQLSALAEEIAYQARSTKEALSKHGFQKSPIP